MGATSIVANSRLPSALAITWMRVLLCRQHLDRPNFDAWAVQANPNVYFHPKSLGKQTSAFSTSASMGIQGLAGRLEPYSTRYTSQQLEGYTAIIDGPGLAYQAHKLALAAAACQSRIPSYADINNEAIKWLSSLEEQGIKVSTILFDGALPDSKRTERVSRTAQNNIRVLQLRASYASTTCPVPTYLGSTSYSLLAPSLREALADSPFASRTSVVPGEADDSCALLAKETPRTIIFTSDSDLILFNYHPETLIVLFQNAESVLGMTAYSPPEIAGKLQLKSLIPFAYAIQQRIAVVQDELIHVAKIVDTESAEYVDFSMRYTVAVTPPTYMAKHPGVGPVTQSLDVRVSEFVHQALLEDSEPSVYLPLLVEDPNQASAWMVAQDVRTLAYSLLTPSTSTIHEYRRKAQSILPHDISTLTAASMQTLVDDTRDRVTASVHWAESKEIGAQLLWPLFALSFVLSELNTPPAIPLVMKVLNSDFDNTWEYIQLAARFHAAIYSLRMLKQIIAIWMAVDQDQSSALHEMLSSLHKDMSSLPSIADTFMVPGQAKRVLADHDVLRALVEEIYTSVGVEVQVEQVSNKKKRRQTREADRKRRKAEQRQQGAAKSANGFALLSQE